MSSLSVEQLVVRRRVPNEGLYIALTQRCPMSCAHCSTNSFADSGHVTDASHILDFVDTMTADEHPLVVLFTGGEPLMRPGLLEKLARRVKRVGSRVQAITGGFWVPRPSTAIREALADVDLLTFSYDRFHAEQVAQRDLFDAIALVQSMGLSISIQTVRDPAVPEFTETFLQAVGDRFQGRVPVMVVGLSPHGRAEGLQGPSLSHELGHDVPCLVATWPVVSYTGCIVACCYHAVVDNPDPPLHLLLGRLGQTSYPEVERRNRERIALRAVRTFGPAFMTTARPSGKYCAPCLGFQPSDEPDLAARFAAEKGPLAERLVQLPLLAPTSILTWPGLNGATPGPTGMSHGSL